MKARGGLVISLLGLIWLSYSSFVPAEEEKAEDIAPAVVRIRSSDSIFYQKLAYNHLAFRPFELAVKGYKHISDSLKTSIKYLAIADFSLPSTEKRFYLINLEDSSVVYADMVTHGRNSGDLYAENFSNTVGSYCSSLGFYLTGECYGGKHGKAIRLDGLDKGFNDNARERAVVMHSADYATENFVLQYGRLGRSQGCPAFSDEGFAKISAHLKDKCLLFIYHPTQKYLAQSVWLK